MGAFYDPDPTQFRNMRLPIDPHTGELIPERWDNWMKHDPVVMFDALGENLRKLKLIYMDCGNHDNFRIQYGMRRFAKKLASRRHRAYLRRIRRRPHGRGLSHGCVPAGAGGCAGLILSPWPRALRLYVAAPHFVIDAALFFRARHLGFVARLRAMRGALHQVHQPRQRLGAVALLGAVSVGADDDLALQREAPPRQRSQPRAHIAWQVGIAVQLEAQLHRGRDFVHVLPAGTGCADEAFLQVALIEAKVGRHWNHDPSLSKMGLEIPAFIAKKGGIRFWSLDMRALIVGASALFVIACAGGAVPGLLLEAPPEVAADAPHIAAALAHTSRPEADIARDELRRPADILAFAQVRPGQAIADVGPGGGYYSRLLAIAVGDGGRVFAVDRPGTAERPRPMAAIAPTYSNITHLTEGYANWNAGVPLDAIFISQIYHDFYLPVFNFDVPAMNRAMFAALKPGGVVVIVDHAAADGSPIGVTDSLHRID